MSSARCRPATFAEIERCLLYGFEIEPFVGVQIENQPVRLLDVLDARAPAVKLDRAHLDAGQKPNLVFDEQIWLAGAVLLADGDMLDVIAKAASVVFLEEAFLRAALRAADEGNRPLRPSTAA